MTSTLNPPPERLVSPDGQITHGIFNAPLRDVDLIDAPQRRFGLPLPRALRALRLKEWQHVALVTPTHLITFAVVHTHYLQVGWVQVVHRETLQRFEHAIKGITFDIRVARSLWSDNTHLNTRGFHLQIINALAEGRHVVEMDVAARKGKAAIQGRFECLHDLSTITPLVVSLPLDAAHHRTMYSHKVPLPVRGEIRIGEQTLHLEPETCTAIFDIHKAYYPHETWWKWATFAGRASNGERIGLNLTHNLVQEPRRYHENGLWRNGQLSLLSPPTFSLDSTNILAPWTLTTEDGEVQLTFIPEGFRKERLRLGIIASDFHQCFGRFEGDVHVDGEHLRITDAYGVCEDHFAKW